MKYLKRYKIFESNSGYSLADVTTYIKDMLLDFEDDGFEVKVKSMSIDRFDNMISISIDRQTSPSKFTPSALTGETFDADRILTFTDRMKSYFDMDRIKYDIQYQWHDDKGVFKETILDVLQDDPWTNIRTALPLPSGDIQNMRIEIFIDKKLKNISESVDNKLFESEKHGKLIPSNWIKLNSIGHVLDSETGWLYPLYSNGIYYEDDNGYSIEWGDVSFDGISDEDMEITDSLWKSVEPIVKDRIDFELIDKLKDLSLDAIDDGFTLYYRVTIKGIRPLEHESIAFGGFNHQIDRFAYNRKFPKNFQHVMNNHNDIFYIFGLSSRESTEDMEQEVNDKVLKTLKDITGYDNIEVNI